MKILTWSKGKIISISAILLLLLCLVTSCGKEKVEIDIVSMYDLRVAMEAADSSFPEMLNVNSSQEDAKNLLNNYVSDIDYEKVHSFFVSYAAEGGLADEIVVIAVKDEADVREAKSTLEEHKQDRYKLLEQYEPKEVKRVKDGLVFTNGRYAVLIISDNSGAVKTAFEEMVR